MLRNIETAFLHSDPFSDSRIDGTNNEDFFD